ncbi:hypothetical protein Avbf_02729, partial [Armadillidium vulgare]
MTTESDVVIKDEPFGEEERRIDERLGNVFYFEESQPYLNQKDESLSQEDIKEEQIEEFESQQEKCLKKDEHNSKCRCNMTLFETIIEEVKKYPCLWNKSLDSYRNQNARDNAWKMVSGALNTPDIDVRKKWASLRDCFRREVAQQQQQRKTTSKLCTKMR